MGPKGRGAGCKRKVALASSLLLRERRERNTKNDAIKEKSKKDGSREGNGPQE
jgi:hypothetical protein